MTAPTVYWRCLTCPATGTTTGTESGADAKHVKAEGHATVTSLAAQLAETEAKLAAARLALAACRDVREARDA